MLHEKGELRLKILYRSRGNRFVAGVCGGLGRYLEVDPTLVRVLWAVGSLMLGCLPGFIAYLVAWAIVPEEPGAGPAAP
ncbi:MAG: PspC domain-containing protein [Patescibacteria group bacterium]